MDDILKDAEDRMRKSVRSSQHELNIIRVGRANPALLDVVKVDYYGSILPLKQVANVAAPDSRLLVVQAFDRNAVSAIEKAIRKSDLGLNPLVDGNLIRLPIPQLNEERRKELVKYVHKLAEEGRVAIRNVRRDSNEMLKELEKNHDISEDDLHRTLNTIQQLTVKYIKEVDELLERKEKEIIED
ncbi:MAG: ribosome recycling factor [Candidatus Neomarinimicrobiota bacterium]|nr:MAG: ribosome recycling factor [Candidatus Neomarinimicrobiota bacterium]